MLEAEVQVEYQRKLERCRICHKIGHRAAHCRTKSIFQPTDKIHLGLISKLENSAHLHPMPDSATLMMDDTLDTMAPDLLDGKVVEDISCQTPVVLQDPEDADV
ncbi:hypothetical protein Nepgr_032313 [Nepenthes gracilis]|uniref:Uncharacterized protein n=1 Tax=Nepenthes gracilis TaxID=150966 RepID=A0AAD3TIC6_NEPGR|nr:hypothetical protein Nepgr_032313 [Nepenthes gracilis]